MKTEIRHSWIYDVLLNKDDWNFSIEDYKKLQKDCKPLEKLHDKYIKKIIELIEKETGRKKWAYDFIPIYIVKVKPENDTKTWKAFADPLTIKYLDDRSPERHLKTIVHELIHMNLDNEEQIKRGREKNEEIVISLTEKVWNKLGIKEQ